MASVELGDNPAQYRFRAPVENVDGTPIVQSLTYSVYRAQDVVNEADYVVDFVLPASLNVDVDGSYVVPVENYPRGRHVVVLTATNEDGDESTFSNSLGFSIRKVPNAPFILAS